MIGMIQKIAVPIEFIMTYVFKRKQRGLCANLIVKKENGFQSAEYAVW